MAYYYYAAVSNLGGFRFNMVKGEDNSDLKRNCADPPLQGG
jgi:hypothetical protein